MAETANNGQNAAILQSVPQVDRTEESTDSVFHSIFTSGRQQVLSIRHLSVTPKNAADTDHSEYDVFVTLKILGYPRYLQLQEVISDKDIMLYYVNLIVNQGIGADEWSRETLESWSLAISRWSNNCDEAIAFLNPHARR